MVSIKKLLGIENFPVSDEEIMARILEAQRLERDYIELTSKGTNVKIVLHTGHPTREFNLSDKGWSSA